LQRLRLFGVDASMLFHAHRLTGLLRLMAFMLLAACSQLHADVGLLLNETFGGGVNGWTSSGHAALYFSRLCAESPLKLRLCQAGEPGVVVSNYNRLGEDQNYEWNAVPLDVYLYGVEDEADRPLLAWPAVRLALQERYRQISMPKTCTGPECRSDPDANWRDLVASTFVRDTYLFLARTTLEQDLKVMQLLNSSPNINRYNGFTNNCADFAGRILNTYFPGSARADRINDFTITSPKAIAKSFTHYGGKHAALHLRVFRFTQMPGAYKPSNDCRKGTEALFRSKRWLFPLLLRPHELAFFTGSYLLTGRFNPEHELRRYPASDVSLLGAEPRVARSVEQPVALEEFTGQRVTEQVRRRARVMGTAEAWKTYSAAFRELSDEAVNKGILEHGRRPRHFVDELIAKGRVWTDDNGAVWVNVAEEDGVTRQVGVAASNINANDSDPRVAYLIMLTRVSDILHRSSKNRELMPYFEKDWDLLLETRARLWPATQRASESKGPLPAQAASPAVRAVNGWH